MNVLKLIFRHIFQQDGHSNRLLINIKSNLLLDDEVKR